MITEEGRKLIHEEFAHLDDVIYLNAALCSVPPKRVQQAYADEMERFISSCGSEDHDSEELDVARRAIAKLINADEDEIAISNNTTAGIDVISLGYPWDPEKNVVIYEREHFANLADWLLREKEGKLKLKAVDSTADLCTDAILNAIDENTQAVTVSAVQYSDGARVDLERIGAVCREKGILLIVDAIQALGRLDIDVKKCNIDFLATGCHKGLMVRNGVGFMYCRRELIEKITPLNGGHHSFTKAIWPYVKNVQGELPWRTDAKKFENGNNNHMGVCALPAALSLLEELGMKNIEQEVIRLEKLFFEKLGDTNGLVRARGDLYSGIFIVPFPEEKRADVQAIMDKYALRGTLRPNNLRLCIEFFNTDVQMEKTAQAVREIVSL